MYALKNMVPKGKNKKLLLYGAVILLLVFFGGQIFNLIKKLFGTLTNAVTGGSALADEQNHDAEVKMADAAHGFNYMVLPKAKQVYQQIADQQFAAMQYAGTDFTSLMNGVKDLTAKELQAVFYLYGLRQIGTFGMTDSIKKNLLQAYSDELTSISLWGPTQVEQMQKVWDKTGMKI
jgi:hypothetical protein